MARPKELPTLDELLSAEQPISDPVRVSIGTKRVDVAFKMLSREDITDGELVAQKRVLEQIADLNIPEGHINSPLVAQLIENETELELLAASMVDQNSSNGRAPAFSAPALRQALQPGQQSDINSKWFVWQTSNDPDQWTDDGEEFDLICENIIEAVKKKDVGTLIGYGSGMLIACVMRLVSGQSASQIGRSLDGYYSTEASKSSTKENLATTVDRLEGELALMQAQFGKLVSEKMAEKDENVDG